MCIFNMLNRRVVLALNTIKSVTFGKGYHLRPDETAQISTIIGVYFDRSDLNIIVVIC